MNNPRQAIPILWKEEPEIEGLTIRHIGRGHYAAPFALPLEVSFETAWLAKFSDDLAEQLSVPQSQSVELTTGPRQVGAMVLEWLLIRNCRASKINTQDGHSEKPICPNSKNHRIHIFKL